MSNLESLNALFIMLSPELRGRNQLCNYNFTDLEVAHALAKNVTDLWVSLDYKAISFVFLKKDSDYLGRVGNNFNVSDIHQNA